MEHESHGGGKGSGSRGLALGAALIALAAVGWFVVRSVSTDGGSATPPPVGPGSAQAGGGGRTPSQVTTRVDAALNEALTLVRDGEGAKADAVLAQAISEFPEEQRLYLSRAEVLAAAKKPAEAYEMLEKALAIGPREGETEFAAGTVASMCGKPERAAEHFQAAQQKMTTDYRPSLFLAQVQVKLKQADAARANLVLAGKLNPDIAVVWGTLAELELAENRAALALQHVARAREMEPRVTVWRVIEARALKRDARPREALAVLLGVEEGERLRPPVLTLLLECYGLLNEPGEAAALCVRAAEADTGNAALARQAAEWLTRAGQTERAAEFAQRATLLGG